MEERRKRLWFNEERKRKYIAERKHEIGVDTLRALFDWISMQEWKERQDLCEIAHANLRNLMNAYPEFDLRKADRMVAAIPDYRNWCAGEGHPVSDWGRRKNLPNDMRIRTLLNMTGSPKDLRRALDRMVGANQFYRQGAETAGMLARCWVWLSYLGLTEPEMKDLRKDDILHMLYGTSDVDVPVEARNDLARLSTARHIVGEDGRWIWVSAPFMAFRWEDIYGDEVPFRKIRGAFKGFLDEYAEGVYYYGQRKFVRREAVRSIFLSHWTLRLSGVFHQARRMEDAGFPVLFETFAVREAQRQGRGPGSVQGILDDIWRLYPVWKGVFG